VRKIGLGVFPFENLYKVNVLNTFNVRKNPYA